MKNVMKLLALGLAIAFCTAETGCSLDSSQSLVNNVRTVKATEINLKIDTNGLTVEQNNVKRRMELEQNSTLIQWIYCLAENGQVVFYGPVKGKVTSSTKQLNKPLQEYSISDGDNSLGPTQNWDGSYGSSQPYVY